ncbi:MAG: SDR family oxidoreductase [Spirochaetales bacterium]|nr:MAG: SDR family oxidoreductase [Spirochaetales bacterium]
MNVFITGGSRGIGRAIVLKFAESGWGCAFTYAGNEIAAKETLEAAKKINPDGKFVCYKMDVKNVTEVENTIETAIGDYENIQAVVNNAAIVANNAAALMSDEEWDSVIATNLSGPFYVIRSLLMHFISNRYGRIINISSLAQDGCSGQANYAASKSGLVGLTNTIAREYGSKGITANIVTVGYVPTDMTDAHLIQKLHDVWMAYCPIKRPGTAEEIAGMVHYLTTEPGGFINGEVIRVAGGLTYIP